MHMPIVGQRFGPSLACEILLKPQELEFHVCCILGLCMRARLQIEATESHVHEQHQEQEQLGRQENHEVKAHVSLCQA